MGDTAFHAGSNSQESPANSTAAAKTPTVSPTPGDKTPARAASIESGAPRSSSGLGRRPFTAKTGVQFPVGVPTEKPCTHCRETKPLEDFNRNRSKRDGRQSWCRECFRTLYRRNPDQREKAKARAKTYYREHPEKKRAQRKLNYQIESGQMVRGFCEMCGSEKADGHHWKGYDRPLDVQWLCRSCHITIEPRRGVA